MKLEGLRTLATQLKTELLPESIDSAVYYFYLGNWYELSTEQKCAEADSGALRQARGEEVAFHATSSPHAWFYLSQDDCAVRLAFPQSPQLATRRRSRERLLKIQASASNAYRVSHNPLTHLLARDAFRQHLAEAIVEVDQRAHPASEAQESGVPRALAILALDIDHFKQVNDTWGHLYGDQVLKTFGRRMETCATAIRSKGAGQPTVFVGHPSGEEFLVILLANVVRDQVIEWANDFRKAISEEILPSDSEWEWLATTDNLTALTPPPVHERALTVSVGVAFHNSAAKADVGIEQVSSLLDRADTALYRAKAAGRNQAITYDDILSTCGRVLEHDKNSSVVALDIGSNVGVTIGQEFKAFSPTFSGKTKFLLNDGRTRRTLGVYPRVESARLVVFNAQPEISFCFIAAPTDQATTLEPGSHLEAIPAGSIGHLLPSSSKYFPVAATSVDSGGPGELQEFFKLTTSKTAGPFAIVIRFSRETDYLRKFGSVALNMALAQMYREAQLAFHATKFVEVLDRASVGIAGIKSAYKESVVVEFTDRMASEFPELGVFAGVFCEADRSSSSGADSAPLDTSHALDFARFAAADAGRSPDTRVRHFSYAAATSVLQALREARSFDVALADFERLRKLGVESASLLNLGGLIAGGLGRRHQAVELYSAAMTRNPKSLIYKSNYATAAYRVGEIEPALKIMNALTLKEIEQLYTLHEYGYHAYARLLAKAKLSSLPSFDALRFAQVAPKALALAEYSSSPESAVIREALA
jgi:diguanylate cyclase (GGDEF)-like protein